MPRITPAIAPLAAVLAAHAEPFEHHPDVAVSLWASEPAVVDPVALCFAANGDCYVAEMRDYPYGIPPEGKPGGTIRLLRDTDGDGKADHSAVFATNLSYPTSVTPWRNGILVAAPPQVLYLEDSDGDDIADVRKVVLDGFRRGVTDGNFSALQWGLDNRIHGTKGASGATIRSPLNDQPPLRLGDYDFAFDPDTGVCARTSETSAGFGLVITPGGHVFSNYNIDYLQQHVIPLRYYEEDPTVPDFEATVNISDHGKSARIFPISEAQTRPNHPEQAGHFSAASGMAYLESAGFAPSLHRSIFIADVVGNLVHRNVLREDGPVFRGARAPEETTREFLASRDLAFRPVSLVHGPDGALYLADMQRDVIEHPDYIPPKMRAAIDIRAGDDRGRIWRIAPRTGQPSPPRNLSTLSPDELAPLLASEFPWRAETAQRLIFERKRAHAAPGIRQVGQSDVSGTARVRVLHTLSGVGALTDGDLIDALRDDSPLVRENALVLAENRPHLAPAILSRLEDSHPRVRFQAALGTRFIPSPNKTTALEKLLSRDIESPWTRRAILCALGGDAAALLPALANSPSDEATREIARAVSGAPGLASHLADVPVSRALLDGLADGWKRQRPPDALVERIVIRLVSWGENPKPDCLVPLLRCYRMFGIAPTGDVARHIEKAHGTALSGTAPVEERARAIGLLARVPSEKSQNSLLAILDGGESTRLQLAALSSLRELGHEELGAMVVKHWRALSPLARNDAIRLLLSQRRYHDDLLDGLESGAFQFRELNLDLEQRRRLLRWSSPDIGRRAKKLFGDDEYQKRKEVVAKWLKKLPGEGDSAKGRTVFALHCATCHRAAGQGHAVGPDLTSVAHRSVEDLLSHILDPNMAINAKYATCSVETKTGETATGILAEEDASAVTLLQAAGLRRTIRRSDIASFRALETSLMPEGLEAVLSPAQMRDLIAFLQHPSP